MSVTSYFDHTNIITNEINVLPYGSKVTLSDRLEYESGYDFVFWVINGTVRINISINHDFVILNDMELIGVFRPFDKFATVFMDANGKMLDIQYISPGSNASDPEIALPSKPGYVVASPAWDKSLNNIQDNTVFILQYEKTTSDSFTVSVTNGIGSGSYSFNSYATVVADEPKEGYHFQYWKSGNDIVSLQPTYTFTVLDDIFLEAVYSDTEYPSMPYVSITDNLGLREGYMSYKGQFFVPDGYELIEHGLITSSNDEVIDLGSSGITRYQSNKYNGQTNEFLISILSDTIASVRAYLVVKDDKGNLKNFYNELVEGEISGIYAEDLFFSYYIEGSSFNKAVAIFNGTGGSVDLSQYSVKLYSNGASSASATMTLSGSLAHGDVYVIAHGSAVSDILTVADATNNSVINFNGDDALELVKSEAVIDSIGQVGFDPGTEWGSGLTSTADNTLKRKSSVTSGRTASSSAFDPSLEWDGYAQDHYTSLNTHTMTDMGPEGGSSASVSAIEAFIPDADYEQGESLNLGNSYLKAYYSDGTASFVTITPEMISGFSSAIIGDFSLTVTYGGKTTSLFYEVVAPTSSHSLMIYEAYGGGGNSGATYNYDYVILYNGSATDINISGYSLQYAAATSSTWSVLSLSGTIYAHTYYIVRLASNNPAIGAALPITPNITGSLNLSATSGKIALVGNTQGITGSSDPDVVDFLGYGTANDAEGTAVSALSNTTSAKRTSFIDSDDNAADFAVATPSLQYVADSLEVVSISAINLSRYYEVSDPLTIGNAKVVLNYNNGSQKQIELTSGMVSGFATTTLGTYEMTITYETYTCTYEYYVIDYGALDEVEVHYIDLGYLGGGPGEAALIKVGGIEILVDAGETSSASVDALLAFLEGIVTDGTIEYVIATHQDADHIGGMADVYEAYIIETTILYSTSPSIATGLRNDYEAIVALEECEVFHVYDIVTGIDNTMTVATGVELVFYDTDYLQAADANASSIVFVLEAFNTRILFNGDAEGNQESVYASLVGDVDIFKLGHHGAAAGTTTYLLETITPEVGIVTNGDYLGNAYSHPTYAALSRIYSYSDLVPVYAVTGGNGSGSDRMMERNGDISVAINASGYSITSQAYGTNPLELSNTAYWNDPANPYAASIYYYAPATGITDDANLKAALNDIISGHGYLSYDALWNALAVTDADPDIAGNVLLFYTNRSQDADDHGGNPDQWNREHVWANSHGIDDAYPGYSDLHHIRATDVTVNNARGDLDFGNVTPHDGSTLVSTAYGYGDVSTYNYKSSSYFEPRDEIKGDVARMLFYMATRYEGEGGEPNLELVDGTTSSSSSNLGDLATLLLWHGQDPVDECELARNELVYGIQGNRNPFIDNPEYVIIVFGGSPS